MHSSSGWCRFYPMRNTNEINIKSNLITWGVEDLILIVKDIQKVQSGGQPTNCFAAAGLIPETDMTGAEGMACLAKDLQDTTARLVAEIEAATN